MPWILSTPQTWLADERFARLAIERIRVALASGTQHAATPVLPPVMFGSRARLAVRGLMLRESVPGWACELGYATSTTDTASQLRRLLTDASVSETEITWDTPGGDAIGCPELASAIRELNARKPVYSLVDGLCCSAGIYCAAQSDSIHATQSSLIGSVGAFSVLEDLSRHFAELLMIDVTVIRSGPAKGSALGAPITDAQVANQQAYITHLCDEFVSALALGRGLTPAAAKILATGEVWPTDRAKEYGLIDAISLSAATSRRTKPMIRPAARVKITQKRPKMQAEGTQKMTFAELMAMLLADSRPYAEGSPMISEVFAALSASELPVSESDTTTIGSIMTALAADARPVTPEMAPEAAEAQALARLPASLRASFETQRRELAETRARTQRLEDERETTRYSAEAQAYLGIPNRPVEGIAKALRAADKVSPEHGAFVRAGLANEKVLAGAHPALSVSPIVGSGTTQAPKTPAEANAKLAEAAAAIAKAKPSLAYHQAYLEAARANPALYEVASSLPKEGA